MNSAVILNGGKSSRLSVRNKALLELNGITAMKRINSILEDIFDEIIIVANDPSGIEEELKKGYKIYPDEIADKGPLGGIYTGLLKINSDRAFFCACDMPFLNPFLIKYMFKKSYRWDVTCPIFDGSIEPLHSIYKKDCINHIEEILMSEESPKETSLFPIVKTKFIEVEKVPHETHSYDLLNINTWQDYKLASCIARQL